MKIFFQKVLQLKIENIKADFVAAAFRAADAGFDSIKLRAGHGYLWVVLGDDGMK